MQLFETLSRMKGEKSSHSALAATSIHFESMQPFLPFLGMPVGAMSELFSSE
jgi:hypothetical protein